MGFVLFSLKLFYSAFREKKKKISRKGLPPASGCWENGPCFQDSPMQFTSNNFNAPEISVALHEPGNLG